MESLEVSSTPESLEIPQVMRILPIEQDRRKQIRSVISPDIRIFEYSDFIITKKHIGNGTYGQIFPATIKSSGKEVVLKRYRKYDPKNIIDEDIIKEIALLQFLNKYPDTKTVFFFGIVFSPRGKIYLVLEALETSLLEFVSEKTLPPEQLRVLFYQLILAFYNIHALGVIHNDIKLGNLMINNGDIRIIDFGLSEYLGVGPSTDLVSGYRITPYYFAPDTPYYIDSDNKKKVLFDYLPNNRKSYASDMYSIGVTLVHAVLKRIVQLKVVDDNIHEVTLKQGKFIRDLTPILKDPYAFGEEGYDLLLKIMNPDTHLRWCSIDALTHAYLSRFQGYVSMDRTVIRGGSEKIYNQQVQYNEDEFRLRQMELKYLEIQHQTFIDLEIPMKQIRETTETTPRMYNILMNWMFQIFITRRKEYNIYSIDSFITTLFFINDNFETNTKRSNLQKLGLASYYIPDCIYNWNTLGIENYTYICDNAYTDQEFISFILNQFIKKNNCKMPIFPVSIHIQYIYLKLKFELKHKEINGEEVLKKLYIDICLHLIFWFIQTNPFTIPISLWEITIFSTNMALSNILSISVSRLNREPLLNFLTLDDEKFINILEYFKSSLLNPDALALENIPLLHKYFYKNPTFHCRYE